MVGPISQIQSGIIVDEAYFETCRNQYIFSGLCSSAVATIFSYFALPKYGNILAAVGGSGVLWSIFAQLGEPDPLQYLFHGLLEFMPPYLAGSVLPLLVLFFLLRFKANNVQST